MSKSWRQRAEHLAPRGGAGVAPLQRERRTWRLRDLGVWGGLLGMLTTVLVFAVMQLAPTPSTAASSGGIITGPGQGGGPDVERFSSTGSNVPPGIGAYDPSFVGGVQVAAGDLNGDGIPDIVTGAGPGGGPNVRVFDGKTNALIASFFAYDSSFVGGVFVAVGDVNGDSKPDIVTGAGPGGGPHVKVFSGADGHLLQSFFAFPASYFGGVTVAAGDVNADGKADIIVGSEQGDSVVSVFNGPDLALIRNFRAYDPGFSGGVFVGAGDVTGDGKADIITGAGPGGGPHAKVFSGADGSQFASFFAYPAGFTGGVRVAGQDLDGDSKADVITGAGAGGGPHVKAFSGANGGTLASFFAYNAAFAGGVFVTGVSTGASTAPPAKLTFSQQPSSAAGGATITPPVKVRVLDANGNLVINATNSITLAIGNNPSSGTLSGTVTKAAVAGEATFDNLSIDKLGTGYTLVASSSGLTSTTSSAFDITTGSSAKLAFSQQPSNATGGATITPPVKVKIVDAGGNSISTGTNSITLAIGNNPSSGTLSGTLTKAAVAGEATFDDLSIDKAGGGYTLVATASGLASTTSTPFDIIAGAASKLAFSVQPANTQSGSAITPVVKVRVLDAGGNVATTAVNPITLAIGTNPSSGTLSGTKTKAAVAGEATFSDLSVDKVGTGYTLVASATGLTSDTSNPFNISAGPATKLAYSVQPTNTQAASPITPAVKVQVLDAAGNLVTSATDNITLAIGTNPASGTLSGTKTKAAVAGEATFSDLSIDKAGNGYTLVASASGLTSATSDAFNIVGGSGSKLGFSQQPSNATGGATIAPPIKVQVLDGAGNLVNTATNSITLAIGNNPSSGTLSGTVTKAAVAGEATFDDLSIDKAGTGYTLVASASGLTSVTSSAFNITTGPAAKLAYSVQPSNAQATAAIAPAIKVQVLDAGGNLVSGATNSITLAIGTNPSSGTLSGTKTQAAVAGVATFNDLSIDKVGDGYTLVASATGLTSATSSAFNITPGTPAKLAYSVQPSNTQSSSAIAPPIKVRVLDAGDNFVNTATNSITLAIGANPSTGTLSGTKTKAAVAGEATFSDLSIDKAGNGYTLVANSTGLTQATSSPFNIEQGAAAKLAFSQQPTNATGGATITPAVKVQVQDAGGNLVSGATNSITLAIGTNPSSGTLSGTKTKAAVAGEATFSDLSIDKKGDGYTLAASSGALTSATSTAFNITTGPAAKLGFSQQPTTTAAASPITPPVKVQVQDAGGNIISGATNNIAMAIGNNPGCPANCGTLSGTTTKAAVAGEATYSDLSIDKTGTGYTLAASSTGLTSATSNPFDITVGTKSKLAFSVQPSDTPTNTAISPPVQVQVQDAGGNVLASDNATVVSMEIGTNPSAGTLLGTKSATSVNGVATFSNLLIDKAGQGYTLVASSGSLTSATSTPFNITGIASKLAFSVQPSNATGGGAITPPVKVQVQDSLGSRIRSGPGASATITMAIGTNPGCPSNCGTLSGTLTQQAVAGEATFSDLSIDKAGNGYTLTATSGSLTAATSNPFNITTGPAAKLAFSVQPASSTASTATIGPSGGIKVQVQDAGGNPINSATNSITMAIGTNPGCPGNCGTLSGTLTKAAVAGEATFSDLSIDKAGNGYTLIASATGLTSGTSSPFNITVGAATKLGYSVQPSNTASTQHITPAVTVQVQDAGGNVVTTGSAATANITVALGGTSPAGGTLSGTLTQTPSSGQATFADLSIDKAGTGYQLVATSASTTPALTSATSNPFAITVGSKSKLAFGQQPTNTSAGATITPAVTVNIVDAGGNVVTSANDNVAIAIGNNPSAGTLNGTKTKAAVNGVVTFSDLSINNAGTGYTLVASSTGLTSATSNPFNIT